MEKQITDIKEGLECLIKQIPKEYKSVAIEMYLQVYNSYPSYRNLRGQEYDTKMNEKIQDAIYHGLKEVEEHKL